MRSLIKGLIIFVERGPKYVARAALFVVLLVLEIVCLPLTTPWNVWIFLRRVAQIPCPRCGIHWERDPDEWKCICLVKFGPDYAYSKGMDYHGYVIPGWFWDGYREITGNEKYLEAVQKKTKENYKKWRTQKWS